MVIEEKYFCGYQYVDADLKMKNSAILCLLEDMAGLHGIYAGESILTAPTTWVLTAYRIVVKQRPTYGDRITMRTWSRSIKSVTACREFEMLNDKGEVILCALSEWAHINKADGSLARSDPELIAAYCSEPDRTNFDLPKIKRVKEPTEYISESSYKIGRAFIDANHHMNNVYYLDLAAEALEGITEDGFRSDTFEIFYKKEIKCGDRVICRAAKTENGYFVALLAEDGETVHAQIILH